MTTMQGRTEVYQDGKVHVRAEQCDRCLFSRDRLVDGGRARELIAAARAEDGGSFICHRAQLHPDEHTAICAVYFDRYADDDWILRLAKTTGIIDRVL